VRIAELARACLLREREIAPELAAEALARVAAEEGVVLGRALRLRAFLTQPFQTTEPFSGRPGASVPLIDTLAGVRAILAGECDGIDSPRLFYRSSLPS
jgi:F-type H+-transporting ATPase subunit beta